jgi:hypothetical protein
MDKITLSLQNPFHLLQELNPKPQVVDTSGIRHLTDEDKKLLQKIGITATDLIGKIGLETTVNWDRQRLYSEITKACISGNTKIWLLNNQFSHCQVTQNWSLDIVHPEV